MQKENIDDGVVSMNGVRKNNMDANWKLAFFDPFVDSMKQNGWVDDFGVAAGQYGIRSSYKGETAGLAWCYPPANENDLSDLSKIIVRGVVPGGTKQESFYFDSFASFQEALNKSLAYSEKRLAEAQDTLDQAKSGALDWKEDLAMTSQMPDLVVREGCFSGRVLGVSAEVATQKVHRHGASVLHAVSALSRRVYEGEIVDITYVNGVGIVGGKEVNEVGTDLKR